MAKNKLKHIELFGGCGGMGLGLEMAGFNLFMANELSPMAAQTFAANLLGENLKNLASKGKSSEKCLWLRSSFPPSELNKRLVESPFDIPDNGFCDIKEDTDLEGKLLVGSINYFFDSKVAKKKLLQLREHNIDLISGGPPCQGFSLAGKRVKDDYKNKLPLSFSKFVSLVRPKAVLLENVYGIKAPFIVNGVKYFSWLEVAKAFAIEGYVPLCVMLNSKYFGVPQNRPRYIMMAFRDDVFNSIMDNPKLAPRHIDWLANSLNFFNQVKRYQRDTSVVSVNDLRIIDIEKEPEMFDGVLLPKILFVKGSFVTAAEAISDLLNTDHGHNSDNDYLKRLIHVFGETVTNDKKTLKNFEERKHSYVVRARFRVLQVLNETKGLPSDVLKILGDGRHDLNLDEIFSKFRGKRFLFQKNGDEYLKAIESVREFKDYIYSLRTKKHSQRALRADEPAPAQLTIPDDLCHYHSKQLRTLTVREMARFQSFPDWFEFHSKVTTGGNRRSFEVPQYTQVGNAVPPLLAYELGIVLKQLLKSMNND